MAASTEAFEIKNIDGLEYLSSIPDGSIDLILTDPPYIISKETGMNAHYNKIKHREEHNIEFVKTEEEWEKYIEAHRITDVLEQSIGAALLALLGYFLMTQK
jgi:site-specific DNA-methyltransferase (adenine-specific)